MSGEALSGYLATGAGRLYWEASGSGEPLLLLHGGFCSLEHLRALGEALGGTRRIFAFERPGHGRSADVPGDYSYQQGVQETLAFLDSQGLGAVHVLGYSDGGIIGLLLAMNHPERVRSLVAVSANLDPDAFAFSDTAPPATVLSSPETGPESTAGEEPDVERGHYGRLSPDGAGHADAVLAKLVRMWTGQPDIKPAQLAGVAAPTLVVSADRDTIRVDHSLLIAASIPAAQLCIVPGATHNLIAERPGFITLAVEEFLATLPAA